MLSLVDPDEPLTEETLLEEALLEEPLLEEPLLEEPLLEEALEALEALLEELPAVVVPDELEEELPF